VDGLDQPVIRLGPCQAGVDHQSKSDPDEGPADPWLWIRLAQLGEVRVAGGVFATLQLGVEPAARQAYLGTSRRTRVHREKQRDPLHRFIRALGHGSHC
jgi:hypothetical protein